ncbi:MAG: hypothetical protein B6D35_10625 [Candidatus Brocadia sp. UTAMX2]|jgi:phosphohistidine swiveling domain-containing protein|nr:MAG: hypothetical protein B6D35_10625 [Candidatus Brocadia sp. UTAMX2]
MSKPKRIAYSFLIGDLFHYGHLKMLEVARNNSDYHICGVISDRVVENWISPKICTFHERKEVVRGCKFVDEVYLQDSMDPTDNLKKIHEKYPDGKIVLVQNHHLWESLLGSSYIAEIQGEIIHHEFYSNLSREKISKAFFKSIIERQDLKRVSFNDLRIGDTNYFQEHFSTKANTLLKLKHCLKSAVIEQEFIFSVLQWENEEDKIIRNIEEIFENKKIVIRSSSLNEDSLNYSNAGLYKSILNVRSRRENIRRAVNEVISSYTVGPHFSKQNQILVQKQTEDVRLSGVVFTRNLWTNTPYYLINYDEESGKTDSVTGGRAGKKVEILRDIDLAIISEKWKRLITVVREIEAFFRGVALDIEFAITNDGTIVIFQVRPLAANSKFHSLDDELIRETAEICRKTYARLCKGDAFLSNDVYLSDMAFWNPAELIGDRPNYLDYSLFNHLIMKNVWNEALLPLGYTRVERNLQVLIGNKPYVNVHDACLCLLPEALPEELKKRLLEFYNKKLKKCPELHDKIEFEMVHNCYRFDFDRDEKELSANNFSLKEIGLLKKNLIGLTNTILLCFTARVETDDNLIHLLEERHKTITMQKKDAGTLSSKLELIHRLVEDCKRFGTVPFTRAARFAFIGNVLLKSLHAIGVLSNEEVDGFMGSIVTVASRLDHDFVRLWNGQISVHDFLENYGHLRPGTYDITKLPYSKNLAYLDTNGSKERIHARLDDHTSANNTSLGHDTILKISEACKMHQIQSDGNSLLNFIRKAIELREYYKFVYTRNISLALELVAEAGEQMGFSREELSSLDYYSIVNFRETCTKDEITDLWRNLLKSRQEEKKIHRLLTLPPLIFSETDFYVIPSYITKPNFITDAAVEGEIVFLDKEITEGNIQDKIVVIEKADPGYDWIFTKKIKGLLTKYGGAASHMAIRCSEFGIPAAIGCGDLLFSRIQKSSKVVLNCKNRMITFP